MDNKTNSWNRNPIRNEGTLAHEIISKSIQYGIFGYLPEEPCAVIFTDGEFSHSISQSIEGIGFAVTRLCDEDQDIVGCTPDRLESMPERSFGAVISTGWLGGKSELEDTARTAFEKLREGGFFIGCAPGRFACSLDYVSSSPASAVSILDENLARGGMWIDAEEMFTPQNLVVTLEAIGYKIIDLFGWQISLEKLNKDYLMKSDWSEGEIEGLLAVELRLAQERSLLGCAPTIQFVARKPNPDEDNVNPLDVPQVS
jgi:hypothetical protein